MTLVQTYVISLVQKQDRRRSIGAHLLQLGIDYTIIDAIYGKDISEDELSQIVDSSFSYEIGHVGCYLSHLAVYRKLIESKAQYALILEDDARVSSQVKTLLASLGSEPSFDYCFLDCENFNKHGPVYYDESRSLDIASGILAYELSSGPSATHAVIVSRQAALDRLDVAFPMMEPIDCYSSLLKKPRFYAVVRPRLAWLSDEALDSSIVGSIKPRRSWTRFLRRSEYFPRLRDHLLLRTMRWRVEAWREQRAERIRPDGNWRRLPSGKEIRHE